MEAIGNQHFLSLIPDSGASCVFLVGVVGMVCIIRLLSTFSDLSFAVHWQGRLSRG